MPTRKIRIALIEDSQTVRFYYKSRFIEAGFEVLEAGNVRQGWDIIYTQQPDIIVLDMMMPEIPGIELLKRLRSVEWAKHIPVLVLSSVQDQDKIREIIAEGADHFCLKGMDSPELIKETVYAIMSKRQEEKIAGQLQGQPAAEPAALSELDRHFCWF
jgi:DNA-binding NarL/FixJ family response regulator